MQRNLPPTSVALNPCLPASLLFPPRLGWQAERKTAARWKEWEPWVWIYLRQRGYAPAASPELARLRHQHREHLLALTQARVPMRLVRRHRLDDPRITDELRAVLVRALRERRRTAWRARNVDRNEQGDPMAQLWETRVRDCPGVLEFPQTTSQIERYASPAQDSGITIDLIRKRISGYFHLRELGGQDLQVRSNRPLVAFPRQLAMYLARQLTGASLVEIGRQFGGRHHTTVLHSIEKIEEVRRSDGALNLTIERLMNDLHIRRITP
jgi:Bacterial dnaA protein helix-turn-helix